MADVAAARRALESGLAAASAGRPVDASEQFCAVLDALGPDGGSDRRGSAVGPAPDGALDLAYIRARALLGLAMSELELSGDVAGAETRLAEAARWAESLEVQPPILDRKMEKFSGGNQQKAVLARWLRTEPKVLLLDEPTQGVDVGAKASIYRQIRAAAERGTAVLVASSDAEELVHLCDRVLVFRSGSVAVELRGSTLTEERLISETLGATSHRKAMKVRREPIRARVIRDDADVPDEPAVDTQPEPRIEARPAAAGGSRLGRTWRALLDRARRGRQR